MQFTIAALAAFVASTTALGINCRGGAFCSSNGAGGTLRNLKDIVDGISDRGRSYSTGQQIACSGSLCAFYQNGASGTAQQTSDFIQDLLNHGCKRCGSVPTQPGNNVDSGELTVNMVNSPNCHGAC